LPEAVVAAFPSPLDIQFRWATPLTEAMQKDPDGTLSRARAIAQARGNLGAATILSRLLGLPEPPTGRSASQVLTISKAGKLVAKLTADAKGRALVRFEAGALPESKRKALAKVIEDFLKS
jgi:ParB family chromosome partitioning protein